MFEPNKERRDWARAQMTEARIPQPVTTAVERLLEVWYTQNHTEQTRDLTIGTFEQLARGFALVQTPGDELWIAAKPGGLVIRDRVRVKADAYAGDPGRMHNGRLGVIVGIRHGDIIVKYDDGKHPPFDGVHHSPHALEKRVR